MNPSVIENWNVQSQLMFLHIDLKGQPTLNLIQNYKFEEQKKSVSGREPMSTLVIVSCSKRKIWDMKPLAGRTKANDAYRGAPFSLNRQYAQKFSDRWVILSAKYGFIDPNFVIPGNYNVTFKDLSTNPISISQLKNQVKQKRLDTFDTVVVLGGRDYAQAVSKAFSGLKVTIKNPLNGLRLGKALAKVKNAIDQEKPFDYS